MAENEYVNKVVYDGDTLIDLTEDTVTAATLMSGYTAHDRSGASITGTGSYVESVNGQNGVVTLTIPPTMTILSYGHSTWADFLAAYETNTIVYCRASSNSNPATGTQTRMAFMAYVNSGENPTNVEFQYYRSVNSHSNNQQGDQTYVYKLDKTSGWSVTVRENYTKVVAGAGLSGTWSNGSLTLKTSIATATLTVAGWDSNTQTVNVSGVTASNAVIVSPAPASGAEWASCGVVCTAQASGTLTFSCDTTPSAAITVNVHVGA